MRRALACVLFVAGCARPPSAPPPDLPRTVAVLPPANHTGDPLLVAGASFFERWALRSDRVTVPDVLAAEARVQLLRRGFAVVPADVVATATGDRAPESAAAAAAVAARARLPGLALWIEVRRWEPDAPAHPAFVIVALAASLVDPASGRVVWTNAPPPAPVATPGEVELGAAYVTAARKAVAALLAPLGPTLSRRRHRQGGEEGGEPQDSRGDRELAADGAFERRVALRDGQSVPEVARGAEREQHRREGELREQDAAVGAVDEEVEVRHVQAGAEDAGREEHHDGGGREPTDAACDDRGDRREEHELDEAAEPRGGGHEMEPVGQGGDRAVGAGVSLEAPGREPERRERGGARRPRGEHGEARHARRPEHAPAGGEHVHEKRPAADARDRVQTVGREAELEREDEAQQRRRATQRPHTGGCRPRDQRREAEPAGEHDRGGEVEPAQAREERRHGPRTVNVKRPSVGCVSMETTAQLTV